MKIGSRLYPVAVLSEINPTIKYTLGEYAWPFLDFPHDLGETDHTHHQRRRESVRSLYYTNIHPWRFKMGRFTANKIKNQVCKSISCASTYVVLTTIVLLFPVFSKTCERPCVWLRENSLGLVWFSIQDLVSFLIFTAELASRVLNTVSLFWQLTQQNRRYTSVFFLSL